MKHETSNKPTDQLSQRHPLHNLSLPICFRANVSYVTLDIILGIEPIGHSYQLVCYNYLSHCYSIAYGTDYKITRVCVSVLLYVCHLSHGLNSHSILMKLYTIDRNPNSKNPFVGGQNPTTPSPIFPQFLTPVMYFQWEGLNTTVTRRSRPVERLWRFMAQGTHLGGGYTGKVEKCI